MKKLTAIMLTCLFLLIYHGIMITKEHQLERDMSLLQAQVNQLKTEQMQLNRQVRELWEAEEKLLWVSQDIDRRLIEVGR